MVVARSTSETFDYVIEAERGLPPDDQTHFHLRHLPASVGMALDNLQSASVTSQISIRLGDQQVLVLRAGLAGWTNLKKADGTEVEFKQDAGVRNVFGVEVTRPAAKEMVDVLPLEVAQELAVAIRQGNTLTKADVGN